MAFKFGDTVLHWIPLIVALKNEGDGSWKLFLRLAEVENAEVASRCIRHSILTEVTMGRYKTRSSS